MKKSQINEVRKFQKIAGILKEDMHLDDSTTNNISEYYGKPSPLKIIKFKDSTSELTSFLNWLEWNYTEASTPVFSTWDTDESYYFDPATLTLVLFNEEFAMEENEEFHEYLDQLKDNIKSIKSR